MARETSKMVEVNGKKVKLSLPTIGMGTTGDLEYSKAYTKALHDGLMPRVAMEKFVIDNNLWTKEDDKRVADVSSGLENLMASFSLEKDAEKRNELKAKFYDLRNELSAISSKRQNLFVHTAESKGEENKIAHLAWQCILNEDGTRVWNSREDLMNETDVPFVSQVLQLFVAYTSGLEEKVEAIETIMDGIEEEREKEELEPAKTEVTTEAIVEVKTEEAKVE